MEKINISDASVAEEIRKQMDTATDVKNGLLSNNIYSSLTNVLTGFNPFRQMSTTTDIDKLYLECDAGLTSYILITAAANSPGGGFLLHFQRLGKGNMTSGSQLVSQFALLMSGEIKYRYGRVDSGNFIYSQWREI